MQHYGQALDVLFYEVLDMPLREYEQLKHMKVSQSCPDHNHIASCWTATVWDHECPHTAISSSLVSQHGTQQPKDILADTVPVMITARAPTPEMYEVGMWGHVLQTNLRPL